MTDKLGAAWAVAWLQRTADVVAENREYLIDLDRAIGDGDHGENLNRGFKAVVAKLADADPQVPADVMKLTASTLMSTVGGASGPLYGTAFMRAAKVATEDLDSAGVVAVLEAALEGIVARGKATTGEKTMVDAWTPAIAKAKEAAEAGKAPVEVLDAAAVGAAEGTVATEPMVATKGRASYLGERSAGHRDPGSQSTTLILEAAAAAAREV